MNRPSLLWFRRDLRLEDHPSLQSAIARGEPVIPVYIDAPEDDGDWPPGAASRWWLHQALTRLDRQLRLLGSKLTIRRGSSLGELRTLITETDAVAVYWTRCYEPAAIQRDTIVKDELRGDGIHAESSNGSLLFEPWEIKTKEGRPYQVFTAFWKACLNATPPATPDPAPTELRSPTVWPESLTIDDLKLLPSIRWDEGFKSFWNTSSSCIAEELDPFLEAAVFDYGAARNIPAERGTSRLSPYLHFGEISPRLIWHRTRQAILDSAAGATVSGAETFLKEIGWREFAYHLLFHFPATVHEPLRPEFSEFPWLEDETSLTAWQQGQTGFPIVDAGMRELWNTGWMHNRVRMITASFLVKDLLISWRRGAEWFWDTLVDADLASNTLGWQWTAGCGADAAPYFRVFNPTLQSEKFDPDGTYLRRWLPELKSLPTPWLHAPWTAPAAVLAKANVRLGQDYPEPIVDHYAARDRALQALAKIKKTR